MLHETIFLSFAKILKYLFLKELENYFLLDNCSFLKSVGRTPYCFLKQEEK